MPKEKAFKSSEFIKTGKRIYSRSFDGHRVDVLLPREPRPEVPVLVVHDGMNVFFKRYSSSGDTWQLVEGIEAGRIIGDPLVIAVWGEGGKEKYNPRRINEFLCDDIFEARPELWETLNPLLTPKSREPRGNYFLALVADEILPEVFKRYGIDGDPRRTAIAGCSVAGVSSIYTLCKRPEIFGAAFGFSSHWEFGGEILVRELSKMMPATTGLKIWSDSGTLGLDKKSWPLNNLFGQELSWRGLKEHYNYETPTFWGTGHHETYWSRRAELPVNFWLTGLQDVGE